MASGGAERVAAPDGVHVGFQDPASTGWYRRPQGTSRQGGTVTIQDLFRPRWRHSDGGIRAGAVRRLTDQALLIRIALDDPSEDVRLEAVRRVQDQHQLAEIAAREHRHPVRKAAIDRLTDETILVELARRLSNDKESLEIASRLSDPAVAQRLYLEIASDKYVDSWQRASAARRLDGESGKPILAELEAARVAAAEFERSSAQCPKCRQRFLRSSCRATEREVFDREDGAFDLVKTTYHCPLCSAEIDSSWSR
jgi:hypothetical protein